MTLDYRNQRLTPSPHAISVFLNTKGMSELSLAMRATLSPRGSWTAAITASALRKIVRSVGSRWATIGSARSRGQQAEVLTKPDDLLV